MLYLVGRLGTFREIYIKDEEIINECKYISQGVSQSEKLSNEQDLKASDKLSNLEDKSDANRKVSTTSC